ncbi:MAG: hypothetical protein V4713_12170 [Pseudomonadota bacterium]
MEVDRIINGRKCTFRTKIQTASANWWPKVIDVFCEGGVCGVKTWPEAMAHAREMAGYADARDAAAIANASQREAERRARVEKHQAKQKRRAAGGKCL